MGKVGMPVLRGAAKGGGEAGLRASIMQRPAVMPPAARTSSCEESYRWPPPWGPATMESTATVETATTVGSTTTVESVAPVESATTTVESIATVEAASGIIVPAVPA